MSDINARLARHEKTAWDSYGAWYASIQSKLPEHCRDAWEDMDAVLQANLYAMWPDNAVERIAYLEQQVERLRAENKQPDYCLHRLTCPFSDDCPKETGGVAVLPEAAKEEK